MRFYKDRDFWVMIGAIAPGYMAMKGLDPEIIEKVMDYGKWIVGAYLLRNFGRKEEPAEAPLEAHLEEKRRNRHRPVYGSKPIPRRPPPDLPPRNVPEPIPTEPRPFPKPRMESEPARIELPHLEDHPSSITTYFKGL